THKLVIEHYLQIYFHFLSAPILQTHSFVYECTTLLDRRVYYTTTNSEADFKLGQFDRCTINYKSPSHVIARFVMIGG
ncbi:MAG: hypothetical protein WA667_09325, partial [Candidatus Nitrosopolaris sp.]